MRTVFMHEFVDVARVESLARNVINELFCMYIAEESGHEVRRISFTSSLRGYIDKTKQKLILINVRLNINRFVQ